VGQSSRLGSIPAPALVLMGIFSVQLGAGIAKNLFDVLPPSAVVTLRLGTSAIVLVLLSRKLLRGASTRYTRRDLLIVTVFGVTLATMNLAIYESFSRIPLGIAVTIEFLGPLGVAVAFSRRRLDLVWVALAGAGVVLLARDDGTGRVTAAGVAFALLAAAGWAAYILLSVATGSRFAGSSGLAFASVVGAALILPIGVSTGGAELLRPEILLLGVGIGLLSSVVPYSFELEALRRMPAQLFGILMSVEPAAAALVGLVVIGEVLQLREWAAIGLVIIACLGATRSQQEPREAPEL
jgi:inner membrane transporter RhtA